MKSRYTKFYLVVALVATIVLAGVIHIGGNLWGLIGLPVGLSGAWCLGTIADNEW